MTDDAKRLDRLRRAIHWTTDDQPPMRLDDLRWAINRICEVDKLENELAHWRSMFANPELARQTFERMKQAIEEALGEGKETR